jgi:hypothetical protein
LVGKEIVKSSTTPETQTASGGEWYRFLPHLIVPSRWQALFLMAENDIVTKGSGSQQCF